MKKFLATIIIFLILLSVFIPNLLFHKLNLNIIDVYSDSYHEISNETLKNNYHLYNFQNEKEYKYFTVKLKICNENNFDVCKWRVTSIKIDNNANIFFNHTTPEAADEIMQSGSERYLYCTVIVESSNEQEDELIELLKNSDIEVKAQRVIGYKE